MTELLRYVRRGSGEPLVLIMGLGGSHVWWGEPFLAALERDFEVIAPDNRGTGLSKEIVAGPFTVADLAADVEALLDSLSIGSAHVLGVSMGGMVAQELVLAQPRRVRTLALGCTSAGGAGSVPVPAATIRRLGEGWAGGDRDRAVRASWELNLSPDFRDDASRYALFGATALKYPTAIELMMLQARAVMTHNAAARLAQITAPTLVIHGTEDQLLPFANGELIASLVPGARLQPLDGVGHMFWWEQPDGAAALVREHALMGSSANPRTS